MLKFFVTFSAALAALGASQYAPAAYPMPTPAAAPVPYALSAGQCQSAAMAGKAVFAKFCFAPKPGSPLDKIMGIVQERLDNIEVAAAAATTDAQAAVDAAAKLTAAIESYTSQANGCTAGADYWALYQDCIAANAGMCDTATPNCPKGYKCAAFNATSASSPTSGFCAPMAAEELCAAEGCDITGEPSAYACFIQTAGPPPPMFMGCDRSCQPGSNCGSGLSCEPASQDVNPTPGEPQAFPAGVYTCQPVAATRR